MFDILQVGVEYIQPLHYE